VNVQAALVETRDLAVGRMILHPPHDRRTPDMYIVTHNDEQGAIAQQIDPNTHQRIPKHFLIHKPGLQVALILHITKPQRRPFTNTTSGSSGTFTF
jgi:hypothetical protein